MRSEAGELYVCGWGSRVAVRSLTWNKMAYGYQAIIVLSLMTLGRVFSENDQLNFALEEAGGLDYTALYEGALARLDMENLQNVTNQPLKNNMTLEVGSTGDVVCNGTILQDYGIPWNDGNSSMHFIDESSYVKVSASSEDLDHTGRGLSVSLWVKTPENTTTAQNCTVVKVNCTVDVGENLQEFQFVIQREVHEDINYVLYREDGTVSNKTLKAVFNSTWNWNMLSFTFNGTIVTLSENGYSNDTQQMEWSQEVPLRVIVMTLNGGDPGSPGCLDLEVDEVALWDRALNMSELLALRVQPFNASCPPESTTTEEPPTTEGLSVSIYGKHADAVVNGSISEASVGLRAVDAAAQSKANLTSEDAVHLVKVMEGTANRSLLSNPDLTAEERQRNIEAYLNIHTVVLYEAVKNQEIADQIDIAKTVNLTEATLADAYFTGPAGSKQNWSTPVLAVQYYELNVGDDDAKLDYGNFNMSVTLPGSVFNNDSQEVLVMIFDKSLSVLFAANRSDSWISSYIFSIQVRNQAKKFEKPISLRFQLDNDEQHKVLNNSATPSCVYLDFNGNSSWKEDGIEIEQDPETGLVICKTSHLTNFAVLMSPKDLEPHATLSALSYILLSISLICLLVTFLVLMCLPEIANTQRVQILKHFIAALLFAQALFVFTTELLTNIPPLCKLAAVLSHYFWVATFTWMLVQGIQLYTKVRRLVGTNIKQIFYIAFAWGFPLPVAVFPILLFNAEYTIGVTEAPALCFIPSSLIWFLAVPLMLIFIVNLGVTILVMKTFLTVKVNKDKSNTDKLKASMRAVIVMVPVLGLTWAFGFLLLLNQNEFYQYLFVILNALQGVFVFLFHLVMNDDVRTAVLRRRNKVASNVENTIFTKVPPQNKKSEQTAANPTDTTKESFPSDSSSNM